MMMRGWPRRSLYRRRATVRPLRATQSRKEDARRRSFAAQSAGSRCSVIQHAVANILSQKRRAQFARLSVGLLRRFAPAEPAC